MSFSCCVFLSLTFAKRNKGQMYQKMAGNFLPDLNRGLGQLVPSPKGYYIVCQPITLLKQTKEVKKNRGFQDRRTCSGVIPIGSEEFD